MLKCETIGVVGAVTREENAGQEYLYIDMFHSRRRRDSSPELPEFEKVWVRVRWRPVNRGVESRLVPGARVYSRGNLLASVAEDANGDPVPLLMLIAGDIEICSGAAPRYSVPEYSY